MLGDSRSEADGTQRVWKFRPTAARHHCVLPDVKVAGYHAWIDAAQLAVFVLGQPPTLQVASAAGGPASIVAQGIGRSLLRRPTGTISFMHREGESSMVKEYDPGERAVRVLVPAPTAARSGMPPGAGRHAVHDRGGEVLGWRPARRASGWSAIPESGRCPPQRLRDGRWMALVASEMQN